MDIASMYAAAAKADPTRPFITFYDDATGERTELSYVTADNWVAKTANLLTGEYDLAVGDVVAASLPPHWVTAAILLGCWRTGMAIAHEASAVDLAFYSETADLPADMSADRHCVVALAPMATGLRTPAGRQRAAAGEIDDFLTEVRGQGDQFFNVEAVDESAAALVALPGGGRRSQAEITAAAADRARDLDLAEGERILLAGSSLRPLDWLLVPLAVKGSVVLCVNSDDADLAGRAATERARIVAV